MLSNQLSFKELLDCVDNDIENNAWKLGLLPVNSHSYYKFQAEVGAVTTQDFNIKILHKG